MDAPTSNASPGSSSARSLVPAPFVPWVQLCASHLASLHARCRITLHDPARPRSCTPRPPAKGLGCQCCPRICPKILRNVARRKIGFSMLPADMPADFNKSRPQIWGNLDVGELQRQFCSGGSLPWCCWGVVTLFLGCFRGHRKIQTDTSSLMNHPPHSRPRKNWVSILPADMPADF